MALWNRTVVDASFKDTTPEEIITSVTDKFIQPQLVTTTTNVDTNTNAITIDQIRNVIKFLENQGVPYAGGFMSSLAEKTCDKCNTSIMKYYNPLHGYSCACEYISNNKH